MSTIYKKLEIFSVPCRGFFIGGMGAVGGGGVHQN